VRAGEAADLDRIEPLWRHLYELQRAGGMELPVPGDGFASWAGSLAPGLGRFACLVVADDDAGSPAGFVAGRIRPAPPWFGGVPVGFVSEVYVAPPHRGAGLAERMLAAAAAWFAERGVARLELQVLSGNDTARALYRRLGWREELVQMVRAAGPGGDPHA
jgi:ribosomal protein S18 acetylase RimI-like enzyme